ncbi:MAG: hypothetical protein K2Y71_17650 [Xanthobacteraceae bacterium]|nr:hypothetical protein [Xanthobacteraceae bacterium]
MAAILALAVSVAGCGDFVSTFTDGLNQAKAVEAELEQSIGAKPRVGFNSHNGKLTSVTVMFPALYESKPLSELAEIVRSAVRANFKQAPGAIVLSFAVPAQAAAPALPAKPPVPHLDKLPIGDGESAALPRR